MRGIGLDAIIHHLGLSFQYSPASLLEPAATKAKCMSRKVLPAFFDMILRSSLLLQLSREYLASWYAHAFNPHRHCQLQDRRKVTKHARTRKCTCTYLITSNEMPHACGKEIKQKLVIQYSNNLKRELTSIDRFSSKYSLVMNLDNS